MLTLTYALVALSVEQKKVQVNLLELQQEIQRQRGRIGGADRRYCESLLAQFVRLDEACRERNIELYVLPAIHAITAEADSLLADVEALTSMGRITLKSVRRRMRQAFAHGSCEIDGIFNSLELYCQHLLKRLAIEEHQLLPLAQRVISGDEWFDIAAQFISHESEKFAEKSAEKFAKGPFGHEAASAQASHVAAAQHSSNAYQVVT